MLSVTHDIILKISGFLLSSELCGLRISCKKFSDMILWACDDYGIHICLGCDLTGSMHGAYDHLKKYLTQTLFNLKNRPGRTLASSMFYWDLERRYDNLPYVHIQHPSEDFSKQKTLISNAEIDSGGGPECGGIALCELDRQFKSKWISRHNGSFGKSIDYLIMCMDAPFHFIVDDDDYYSITRKHAINTDWVAAIQSLYEQGVIIIMFMINTQPSFKKALELIGGFNNSLGGISMWISINSIKQLPLFVDSIIEEEVQRRDFIYETYKRLSYANRYMPQKQLSQLVIDTIAESDHQITCANIPSHILIDADNVQNARELSHCSNMSEAIDAGLLESEDIFNRLNSPEFLDILEDFSDVSDEKFEISQMPALKLTRQMTQCPQQITTQSSQKLYRYKTHGGVKISKIDTKPYMKQSSSLVSFGLERFQSTSPSPSIGKSVRCCFKEPDIDFGPKIKQVMTEEKFREHLLKKSPKQYELYVNGGLFGRFQHNSSHQNTCLSFNLDPDSDQLPPLEYTNLVSGIPTLRREISHASYSYTNTRISRGLF
jgi:hypothetical protein